MDGAKKTHGGALTHFPCLGISFNQLNARGVRFAIGIAASIVILVARVSRLPISKVGGGRLDLLNFHREDDSDLY
jgi:hypothetical protein